MPKSSLEKQLEKNRLEIKRQAEKDRKEAQKQAYEEQIRQQAASIVNAQDVIDGFRVIDRVSESVLKTLLELCTNKETGRVSYENTAFDVLIPLFKQAGDIAKVTTPALIETLEETIHTE